MPPATLGACQTAAVGVLHRDRALRVLDHVVGNGAGVPAVDQDPVAEIVDVVVRDRESGTAVRDEDTAAVDAADQG